MQIHHVHQVQHTLSYTPQHRPFQYWSLFIVIGTFWALILFITEDFWDAFYMAKELLIFFILFFHSKLSGRIIQCIVSLLFLKCFALKVYLTEV